MLSTPTARKNFDLTYLVDDKLPLGRALDFNLPPALEAAEPPEARGLDRDEVRLMVSYLHDNRIVHTNFRRIDQFLDAGDVLVINTSGTLNAALSATRADGQPLELHLSTRLPGDRWTVEVRQSEGATTRPFRETVAGEKLGLPVGGSVTLARTLPGQPPDRTTGPALARNL